MIVLDGCDEAIIGHTEDGLVAYCYEKLVEVFQAQGMSRDDAIDWISYNCIGLGPIVCIVYPGGRAEIDEVADNE